MSFIFKLIGNLIAIAFGIFYLPIIFILLLMNPIMAISDGIKIIQTGYSVYGQYLSIVFFGLMIIYFSLRFKYLRKIYFIFPSLFEIIKFLAIANIFISAGIEIINWSYTWIDKEKHIFGIAACIISLVIWRVLISIYYYKKPLINFKPDPEEVMTNYNR